MSTSNTQCTQTFRTAEEIATYFANTVRSNGTPHLAGLEEEIGILDTDGRPLPHGEFQLLLADLITALPEGQIHSGRHINGDTIPVFRGSCGLGLIQPETNTTLIEFAHAPTQTVWQTHAQSAQFASTLHHAAQRHNVHVVGFGTAPTISWQDLLDNDVTIPNADFIYSWTHMTQGTRPEYCRTVFGTGSTHHNMGFNDPEELTRYTTTTLRLQPTMIALLGNGALWDNTIATAPCRQTGQGTTPVLSHRSRMQIDYGHVFGAQDGVDYLYPDFLINPHTTFNDLVNGYLDLPLDRTYAGNDKVSCNGMTMRDYLTHGLYHNGEQHFPTEDALTMMIREPIVDVRPCLTGTAPRVETRAHDGVSHQTAVALDAFYRGIRQNLDAVQELLAPYPAQTIRQARYDVCTHGLATRMPHPHDQSIQTQQHLAQRLLSLAEDGLRQRNQGEEAFLSPLQALANSGRNPEQRLLSVIDQPSGHTNQARQTQILEAMNYTRPGFADSEPFPWPTPQPPQFA